MAKATPPVSRAKAEAALAAFLARVAEVNESDRFICRVEEVVLFGSFLDPTVDPVGDVDVDVAVAIRLKPTDANVGQLSLAHARASGRALRQLHRRDVLARDGGAPVPQGRLSSRVP